MLTEQKTLEKQKKTIKILHLLKTQKPSIFCNIQRQKTKHKKLELIYKKQGEKKYGKHSKN